MKTAQFLQLISVVIFFFQINLCSEKILYTCQGSDAFVSIIQNDSKRNIVKQIMDPALDEQFLLVLDMLGSIIAEHANIPCNRLLTFSSFQKYDPLKKYSNLPAAHFSFVPGMTTENKNCIYNNIDIQQRFRKKDSYYWKKYGPLPSNLIGISRNVFQNAIEHSDLVAILALDTFLGNADRSKPNLFYDIKANSFWGIDFGGIFNKDLSLIALKQIKSYFGNLSKPEKEGLRRYLIVLSDILNKNSLDSVIFRLFQITKDLGFPLDHPIVQARLHFHSKIIQQNYYNTQKLIYFLERKMELI